MLREEQIDIRRQRAVEGKFVIQNLGRNRVFSDYQVSNPVSGGQYRVSIRGFEVGDNSCTCRRATRTSSPAWPRASSTTRGCGRAGRATPT